MLRQAESYKEVYESFQWKIPGLYNIARDVCDKWSGDKYRLCLIYEDEQGSIASTRFGRSKSFQTNWQMRSVAWV